MRVSATAKYLRGSTRKANLVVAAIKGRPVEEAAALLKFMPQHAAHDVRARAQERDGQRREQPQPVRRGPDRRRCPGQRGPDDQALAAAGPGSGVPDPQAHDPHHDRRRGPGGLTWDTRSIRTASAWVSRAPGPRSGTRTRNTPTSSRRTSRIRKLVEQAARQRQRQRRRDRARHQPRDGHDPHGQARDRHRQGRRQRRGPAPADRRAHEAQGQAGDQGDPPAGARRLPRRDEHRRPADPPDRLQEGDEAGDPALDEGRRQGRQDRRRRPPRRLRDGPPRVGPRRSHPARARSAPTSATARSTPTRPTAGSASRSGSTAATSPRSARPPRDAEPGHGRRRAGESDRC